MTGFPARSTTKRSFSWIGIASVVMAIVLLVLILYPLIATLIRSFVTDKGLDLSPFTRVLSDPVFLQSCGNTGIILVVAGAAALIIGSLFAWVNERTDARLGPVSALLPLISFFIPTIGLAIGWLFLGQQQVGFLNAVIRSALNPFGVHLTTGPLDIATWPGVLFLYTVELVPYVYLVMSAALRNVDPSLEEASRMSGASAARTALRISLPAVRPSIASAALLIVVVTLSTLSIPLTIGTTARINVISVYLVRLTQAVPSRLPDVVAVSVLLLVVVGIAVLVNWRVGKGARHSTITGKSGGGNLVRLGKLGWVARALMILYLFVVAVLPLFALIIVAIEPYWTATINPATFTWSHFQDLFFTPGNQSRQALGNSLLLALIGATVCMIFATSTAIYSKQNQGGVFSGIVRVVTKLPAGISHLVIAVSLLVALGGIPFHLSGTLLILILAYLVIYVPQASISAESARNQVGPELLEASYMSGGASGRTTWRILLPLMGPGLASGWSLVFVLIVGDLTAAAILSGPNNLVIGAMILNIWDAGIFAQLATLGTVICFTSAVVVGVVLLARRRRRRFGDNAAASTETGSAGLLP